MNFLEAIGALTLVFGALYLWLNHSDQKEKDIKFLRWILDNDITAQREFNQFFKNSKYRHDTSKYSVDKAIKEFFTDEKLAEVNARFEEKEEGTP